MGMVRGKVTWKGGDLGGDMVIPRAAGGVEVGQPLYNMAVVVDDMDMEITHVIRGEDHIANTAKQILLYEALEGKIPEFGHTPLILNKEGRKLSKRDGVTSISDFKELGFTPEALVNYMCLLGWTPPDATEEIFTLAEAGQKFNIERVNKAGAKFDWDKLDWISSQYLHSLPVEQLTDKLIPIWQKAGYVLDPESDRSWLEQLAALIGPSLTRLTDAVEMSKLFFLATVELDEGAKIQMEKEDSVQSINSILEIIDTDTPLLVSDAQRTINQVAQKVNVKKGVVMRSLRASLTGTIQGPDLIQSWLLLHQKGFDILRFKKSIGQEIEETKKSESTSNNNKDEDNIVIETQALKSSALSKEETQTTRTPEQKKTEPTIQKERKISTSEATSPTTTDVPGKSPEAIPETETKISTSEATSPTTTGAETKVQKVATQIETSILDDQKPVNTVINKTIDIEQPNQSKEQLSNIFFDFPDYISQLYQKYQSQLQVFILLVLAILILILITDFIKALKEIPILSMSFELIGIIYVFWFVYYYLLRQFNRQELLDKIENIIVEIVGKKS